MPLIIQRNYAKANIRWKGATALGVTRKAFVQTMKTVSLAAERDLKRMIKTPYPPASQPYDPPHRRTGTLYRAVYSSSNQFRLGITVGYRAQASYAKFLEEGTSKMERRPSLQIILNNADHYFKLAEATAKRRMAARAARNAARRVSR